MELIFEDKQKRIINGTEEFKFSGPASFYLILLTIRVKSKKQDPQLADNESVSVQIDNKLYTKPVIFLGNRLKNLSQAIYFFLFLDGQDHRVILTVNKKQPTAGFENLEVFRLGLEEKWDLAVNNQAEDGDRRPWLTFVLENLPLLSFMPTITYARRKRDSDDVKIIIDGQTQTNLLKKIRYFFWRFAGSFLPWSNPVKTEAETFTPNFSAGLHAIELEADRMPILNSISFDFGISQAPKRIPTVENPKWTGNFNDDSDEILLARLIFGEAEGVSQEAKIAVGWTVKNRVLAQRKEEWGLTYHEVILKPNQYAAFTERLDKLSDPLNTEDETVKQAWYDSYKIATQVTDNNIPDLTGGATNFYSTPINAVPLWVRQDRSKIQIDNLFFYKL